MLRGLPAAVALIGVASATRTIAQDRLPLAFDAAQTAVLDPANWDEAFANERYFDALRGLLVRFPGAATDIHARLAEGYEIETAQLELTWERQEGARPERGRHGWGSEDAYTNNPGQWSVQAWALKQPWNAADPELAPTFNAYVNGLGFWERGGARGDGSDRHPTVFGPAPLHPEPAKAATADTTPSPNMPEDAFTGADRPVDDMALALDEPEPPKAVLDVTACLVDAAYGTTLGERLRALEERGFLIHKRELYDLRYLGWDGYDWNVATGYMRIWVESPKLIVHLRPAADAAPGPLPPPLGVADLAERLRAEGARGVPSIAIPSDLKERVKPHFAQPSGMPDWQWARIEELMTLGNPGYVGRFNINALAAADPQAYREAMRNIMLMPPRFWHGFLSTDFINLILRYPDLFPEGVQDHLRLYWQAWIHPELETRDELPRWYRDGKPLFDEGVPSFFRGYSQGGGTMGFGHVAVEGVLLAAEWLGAEHPLREARSGLQRLLRGWSVTTGAHQCIGDTYYQALVLGSTASMAQLAQDPLDALTARIHLDRLVEPLISMYHPGVRRITHPQGRGQIEYQFLFQDAPYHILHSHSRDGVLLHMDDVPATTHPSPNSWGSVYGVPVLGGEGPPARVAMLSPWLDALPPDAVADLIDRKPTPWRVHARSFNPGEPPGWHVNFIADHYVLSSIDNAVHSSGIYSAAAQWRRSPRRVNHVDDLGTLFLSAGVDGVYQNNMGAFNLIQHDSTIVATKQALNLQRLDATATSLHASVLVMAHGDTSAREVWINDRRVAELNGPQEELAAGFLTGTWGAYAKQLQDWRAHTAEHGHVEMAQAGDRIAIRDGLTYIGLIPMIIDRENREQTVEISYAYPALMIHADFYRADEPFELKAFYESDAPPTAGFVIRMGDEQQYGSFEAFRQHLQGVTLELAQDTTEAALTHLTYQSGNDRLEMGCRVNQAPAYRRINAQWPYLPEGVLRRSNWAVQGSTGRLDLHGAGIHTEAGRPAYLMALPDAGVYVGYNLPRPPVVWFGLRRTSDTDDALPDVKHWTLSLPGGLRIESAGRIGLARVRAWTKDNRIMVEHAFPRDANPETTPDLAPALLIFGPGEGLRVSLNGIDIGRLAAVDIDGETAWILPLTDPPPDAETAISRWRASRKALAADGLQD